MIIDFLIIGLLIEALVELFFKAAPLQGIRRWLVVHTPFLYSEEQGHLLECKYCVSFWVAVWIVFCYYFLNNTVTQALAVVIVVARLSNFVHIVFGLLKDKQINMRLDR